MEKQGQAPEAHLPNPNQVQNIVYSIRHNQRIYARPPQPIDSEEMKTYMHQVKTGEIGRQDYDTFLNSIARRKSQSDPDTIFGDLNNSVANSAKDIKHMRGILAHFTLGNLQNRPALHTPDMMQFLISPEGENIVTFEESINRFLDTIEKSNGKEKRTEYEKAVDKFGKIVYGKQWEYLQQIRLLEKQAKRPQPEEIQVKEQTQKPTINLHGDPPAALELLASGQALKEENPSEELVPRELEGFDKLLAEESRGGNAGPNRGGANAYYKDGRFHFWTGRYPREEIGNSPEVLFGVRDVPITTWAQFIKEGKPIPPSLIDEIATHTKDEEIKNLFQKRALQHNAFKILSYLQKGGDPSLLPSTPIMPDIDKLKQILPSAA